MLGLGLILATIAGFVVTPILIDQLGYLNGALAVAVLAFVCMLAPLYAAPPATSGPPPAPVTLSQTFRSFIGALRNRRFLALLALLAGSQMSFTVLTAAAPFIATGLLAGTEKDVSMLLGPLILTAVPMFYFAPKVSRALGWERALMVFSLLLGLEYILCSVLIGSSLVHSPVITAAVLFSLAGPMIAVLLALDAEAITGCVGPEEKGAVGMYFGAYNLVIKTLNGVAVSLTGVLVGLSKGAWGSGAIRFMIIVAGLLLFCGVAASLFIRRGGRHPADGDVISPPSPAT
jgi:Na+/melibiose symporter-like transporter